MADWGSNSAADPWASNAEALPATTNGDAHGDTNGASFPNEAQGSGDAFNTSDMAAALPEEQTGEQAKPPLDVEQEKQKVKDAGWVEPVPYDYERYTSANNVGDDLKTWEGNARVYEWDGEEGDLGPEFPELERELFGNPEQRETSGIDFSTIAEIQLTQEGPVRVQPVLKFQDAGLHPAMLRNVELAGYDVPTPIQMYCLPAIQQGFDVIGIAQTGSGKTAAYLIPIINKLMGKAKKLAAPRPNPATFQQGQQVRAEPLVVIVCPSRELAIQIFNEARKFCYRSMLRPCVLYGGGPIRDQVEQLAKGCDILIASPGRLIDFMERPAVLTLRRVRYMVIDEADEMLHQDWEDEFNKILSGGEQEEGNIAYMLFSATFPKKIRDLAKTHLAESHVRFRVGRAGSSHSNIKQQIIWTDPWEKRRALVDLLHSMPPARTIIFVNSKRTADELDAFLFELGLPCTSMHADRTQKEREDAMRAFRRGDTPILITTGVASRGIDVRNVMHVVNFDLPSLDYGGIEEYTHRIGRTGRIGHRGMASSFYTERDEPLASVLTRTLLETKQEIPSFFEQYIPEGDARVNLKFEADSDWESEAGDGGWGAGDDSGGGGWGSGGGDTADASNGDASGWGATPAGGEDAKGSAAADAKLKEDTNGGDAWGGGGGGSW